MAGSIIVGQGGKGAAGGVTPAVGVNGSVAPTSSIEIGFIDSFGNEQGVSATNPLPVTGTVTASNPSVGLTGATAPTSATEIGVIDISGNLQGASASNPVRIDPTGTTLQPVSGTITANQGTSPWVVSLASTTITGTVAVTQSTSPWVVAGGLTNNNAAPSTNNVGVLPALANAAAPTFTEGDQTLLSVALTGHLRVGTKTNNSAAPAASTNVGSLGAVANAAGPLWTEGNQVLASTDLNGGQRIISANIPEVTAAWTSATAGNTTLSLTILGYSAVVVTLNQGTTITGGVVTFEVSDTTAGTNWYPILVTNAGVSSGTLASTFTLVASTNSQFMVPVAGWAAFRVRLSTTISGTATVNVGIQAANFPVQQNTVNVVSGTITNTRSNVAVAALADNQTSTTFFASSTNVNDPLSVGDWAYGGAFSGAADAVRQGWSKFRTPTVFKTVQATASGNTAIWTPGTGNKFRLLRFLVSVSANAFLASAGVLVISFQDAAVATSVNLEVYLQGSAPANPSGNVFYSGWIDLGQFGILSAAANNVLNVNLSTALSAGDVRITVCGTEE